LEAACCAVPDTTTHGVAPGMPPVICEDGIVAAVIAPVICAPGTVAPAESDSATAARRAYGLAPTAWRGLISASPPTVMPR